MATNNGEQAFEALIVLGYHIEISEEGAITAMQEAETIRGKAVNGVIEWADSAQVYRLMQRAYVAKLRARVHEFRAEERTR